MAYTIDLRSKILNQGLYHGHCYHVKDFLLVNGTPGIIQDPIDLLLAKCNLPIKRSTVLVFNGCNTVDLLMGELHFANKRSTVLVFNACNTVDL